MIEVRKHIMLISTERVHVKSKWMLYYSILFCFLPFFQLIYLKFGMLVGVSYWISNSEKGKNYWTSKPCLLLLLFCCNLKYSYHDYCGGGVVFMGCVCA